MFEFIGWVFLSLHYTFLLVLCVFGIYRLSMVARWYKHKDAKSIEPLRLVQLPKVTIQIPIFNERNVAGRSIDQAVKMDYPRGLLQIQVVDDSTDDTYDLIADRVAMYQQRGIDIQHVHRIDRSGFKAGALRDAMNHATGEFIAIFDADFLPPISFLQKTIHRFSNPKLAMIQTRWSHLNLESNRLTRAQAVMLDAHFALEQQVRSASNMLFSFNGSAGMWRVDAIVDAGHWSADTLTEDIDLSYRAHLRGWQMAYVNGIECPAELPSKMQAFKSQQHRWVKGGVQVMKKMLRAVWQSNFSLAKKVEATFHLSSNLVHSVLLVDAILLLIPSLIMREHLEMPVLFWLDLPLLVIPLASYLLYLCVGQLALNKSMSNVFARLPALLLLGTNLAYNNARAAVEALLGHTSEFVRTPKCGELQIDSVLELPAIKKNYLTTLPNEKGLQLLTSGILIFAAGWAVEVGNWYMMPFLIFLSAGFSLSAIDNYSERLGPS